MILNLKQQRELKHNRKILEKTEKIWGRCGKIGRLRVERRAKMIQDLCAIDKTKKVLEIGCGTGALTQYLTNSEAEIIAIDIFQEFLEIAKKKILNAGNVKFQIEDAEFLKTLKDNSFDVVCGLSILHHLNTELCLKNIYRVLKPGGYLAFSEPNMLNPQIAIQKNIPFLKKLLGDSPDETAFFKWQIKKLLKKNNFINIKVRPFDFLHPALPDFSLFLFSKISQFLEKIPLIKETAGSLIIFAQKPKI